jgi:hypothetical protein
MLATMEENSTNKIFNPFKDLLTHDLVTKAKSGITDLVSGVKNLFRNDHSPQETEVNNYLKSPDEIEAELRIICVQTQDQPLKNELVPQDFITASRNSNAHGWPANFHSLEEALAGEMEENY